MMLPGYNNQGQMGQAVMGGHQILAEKARLEQERKARRNQLALDVARSVFEGIGTIGGLFTGTGKPK